MRLPYLGARSAFVREIFWEIAWVRCGRGKYFYFGEKRAVRFCAGKRSAQVMNGADAG